VVALIGDCVFSKSEAILLRLQIHPSRHSAAKSLGRVQSSMRTVHPQSFGATGRTSHADCALRVAISISLGRSGLDPACSAKWMWSYNHECLNKALGDVTLKQRLVLVA